MIENLYAKYILADRLNKIAETAGVAVHHVKVSNRDRFAGDVHLQVGMPLKFGAESNEDAAVRLLDAMPELSLRRRDGLIYLDGTTNTGLTFQFYAGQGVCERVQVGTRTIPAEPERVIPAQPEREEPIYEILCADPLREAVAS